jgi:fatty-acyl-CoA synthase
MLGTMMDTPLTLQHVLWRAERLYGEVSLVTLRPEGPPERSTYGEMTARARRLAGALAKEGVHPGDRVATFAWNTQRHLELYYAVPCMGAVLHTLNVRLFEEQLEYIVNHAEDRVIFCDRSLLPSLERLAGRMPSVRLVVLMNDGPEPAVLTNTVDFDDLLACGDPDFAFPALDESAAAAMCYTSGTTGNPKGVVYSHRSSVLHSLVAGHANNMNISERDTVLYAVPMFHANAWGLPYTAALVGASQVLTDRFLQPDRLLDLLDEEKVTFSAGVPTIWIGVLNLLEQTGRALPCLREIICGGSAVPPALIAGFRRHGITLLHAWGMTETSPFASVARLRPGMEHWSGEDRMRIQGKQGRIAPTVEARVVDLDTGVELPWDGTAIGELQVRGPYITGTYYHDPTAAEKFMDGWLRTGDVATIDEYRYIQLVDRTKDLVKSGGEWISSVELENLLMAHPQVLEAAVVGLPHPRWSERPVAAVVPKTGFKGTLTAGELTSFLSDKIAKWWMPDEIVFLDEIPKTSVGKFAKTALREQLAEIAARWANAGA